MEPCGIYQITNLHNNKKYIGQSKRIYSRWKQHTQSLNSNLNCDCETPLRRAFLKYGLNCQVSFPGEYSGFKFEVVLECEVAKLDDAEYDYIRIIDPEYNIMLQKPSEDRLWPLRDRIDGSCYIQYHNAVDLGYYPFEINMHRNEVKTFITSKKRDCLRCKGEKVYLIVGVYSKKRKRKSFYLWGYSRIEEIEIVGECENAQYGLKGIDYFCERPVLLNELDGFESFFKKTMGSFAYGLQNAAKDKFVDHFTDYQYLDFEEIGFEKTYIRYLSDFELNEDIKDDFILIEQSTSGDLFVSLFEYYDDEKIVFCRARAIHFIEMYPEIAIQQILDDTFAEVHYPLFSGIEYIIEKVRNVKHVIHYFNDAELKGMLKTNIMENNNVEFVLIT